MEWDMAHPGRSALDTLGNVGIQTNSLTARGGFAGGAVVPDTEKVNKSIEGHTKSIESELQKLNRLQTEIKDKLGT